MPTLSTINAPAERKQKIFVPPTLKIDLVPTKEPRDRSYVPQKNSDVNLSVCIQDIPHSPTQHAEYTLALAPSRRPKKCRLRKQPVIDIHACFDVNDLSGTITVVDESVRPPKLERNCKRYERDSIDLLERYDQLHPESQLTSLTSPNQQVPHSTRHMLLEHSCSR